MFRPLFTKQLIFFNNICDFVILTDKTFVYITNISHFGMKPFNF